MKKYFLFSLICILGFVGIVSAKTQIEYEYGFFVPSSFMDAALYKNDFFLFHSTEKHLWAAYYDRYDMKGNKLSSIERNNNEVFYIFEDVIMSFSLRTDEFFHTIYDENFNVISKKPFSRDADDMDWYNYGETDEYYYIGSDLFTKDNYEHIDVGAIITAHPSYDSSCKEYTPENIVNCFKMTASIIEEEFPNTHLPAMYKVIADDKWLLGGLEFGEFFINHNGGGAFDYFDYETRTYGFIFYDEKGGIIHTIDAVDKINGKVFYKDNKIYTLRIFNRTNSNNKVEYYYMLTEYDENFNILNEFELETFDGDRKIKYELSSESFPEKILLVDGGFLLFSDHYYFNLENEDEYLKTILPAVLKYNFIYSVDTKENDNGSITVDKESSKNGEIVKFTVQPKEGYKLDKVIVTDEQGNKIVVTDNSFTMPNANVTIEAIFVVDNPNTSVFLSIAVACIIAFACYFFIVLKNMKIKQYE